MAGFFLTQKEHLKKNKDFLMVYNKGCRHKSKSILLYLSENNLAINRIGVSISKKKIAKPTVRNRIKRLIRESYRLNKNNLKPGFDLIFVIINKDTPLDFNSMDLTIKSVLKKAGLIL